MWESSPGRARGRRTVVAVAVGLLAGVSLLSGCSGSSGGEVSGGALTPSTKAKELLIQAKENVADKQSVHIGGLMVTGGAAMDLDVNVIGLGATGSLGANGGKAQVRVVDGQLYLNGDAIFWDALKKGTGDGFSDSWVKLSASSGAPFADLLSLAPVTGAVEKWGPTESAWAQIPGREVDGEKTVGLRNLQSGHGDTVYVSTAKPPMPLQIELAQGGQLNFTRWDGKPKAPVTAPKEPLDATLFKLNG